ncbi:hypothetical protein BD309DRAFT_974634 [Dichomitus squalens]|uniref:Uncharacterized protein n=1 Tax=Dichomitus squalens TaxID=114155 RepID=A0A4Q9NA32_9APHY|nr:hypothetical protein BD309DRAFT_974634 [Dichomitus squalens]TBU62815.1 hypothetical protein BD310DRAFT_918243 [Dichomitus squalens]
MYNYTSIPLPTTYGWYYIFPTFYSLGSSPTIVVVHHRLSIICCVSRMSSALLLNRSDA